MLYEIDCGLDVLVTQDPPNDGVLKTVGPIGFDVPDLAGMDIVTGAAGKDDAYAAWGTTLYSIDLSSGRATPIGPIPGATRPIVSLAAIE